MSNIYIQEPPTSGKDEFHSRLRFVRRGLVAMASGGADDNGSQFFFTLGSCPDLQNKHTIFGKVVGETLYNMLRLEESLVDAEDRPLHPHRVIATQVLVNPFDDIIPRKALQDTAEEQPAPAVSTAAATRNYNLLSFGDEAEEEEEELMAVVSKDNKGRSKSSHDLTDDASLSSVPAVGEFKRPVEPESAVDLVRQRMRQAALASTSSVAEQNYFEEERQKASAQRIGEIRKEFRELRRQMRSKEQAKLQLDQQSSECDAKEHEGDDPTNQLMRAYRQEQRVYTEKKQNVLPKGAQREQKRLPALARRDFPGHGGAVKNGCTGWQRASFQPAARVPIQPDEAHFRELRMTGSHVARCQLRNVVLGRATRDKAEFYEALGRRLRTFAPVCMCGTYTGGPCPVPNQDGRAPVSER
ncbi:spliceosome-associated protein CWC27 homolog isoform X2 [Dermacentor variabilis]|uniref:spliceosome-associated protein CWC27 homolog isoform X2 n=1 Tax=Dermacentor variabilis TaxID=34621 RepID=UPI003F5CB329